MISSKKDYLEYIQADMLANGMHYPPPAAYKCSLKIRFLLALRKAEYTHNCGKGLLGKIRFHLAYHKMERLGIRCGYTIPINVCGKGLSLAHLGTIVINGKAKIGDYCRIHTCVNIGTGGGKSPKVPVIGDRVYIGPGAKLFGEIIIADDIAIGANSVVNKSFTEKSVTIAGVPARVISHKGSQELIGYCGIPMIAADNPVQGR